MVNVRENATTSQKMSVYILKNSILTARWQHKLRCCMSYQPLFPQVPACCTGGGKSRHQREIDGIGILLVI